jgi:hypothetical protein
MQEINEFYSYSEMDDLSRKRGRPSDLQVRLILLQVV